MIDTYVVKTVNGDIIELVDKTYIDYMFNEICSEISEIIGAYVCVPKNESMQHDVILESEKIELSTDDIHATSRNSYISFQELQSLKDRPTNQEVDKKIDLAISGVQNELKESFGRLLNDSASLDKIKMFVNLIKDEGLDLKNYVTNEDIAKHLDSDMHLSSNDRKALNALINCIKSGSFADWSAGKNSVFYIKNKPEIPEQKDIKVTRDKDLIIGSECSFYTDDDVDICLKGDYSNTDAIASAIENIEGGRVSIRHGLYLFHDIKLNTNVIMELAPDTTLIDSKINLSSDSSIVGGKFTNSILHLSHRSSLTDITLDKCNIYLDGSYLNITGCTFNNCNFYYNGVIVRCIISLNKFLGNSIKLLSNDNIIQNNLTY